MEEGALRLVQQYLQPAPLEYHEPLFSELYHDLNGFARQNIVKVLQHRRPVAIYGERGIGKSTAMHGVLAAGLSRASIERPLPIIAMVTGAGAAENLDALQRFFYRAIVSGIARLPAQKKRLEAAKQFAAGYGPAIGGKIVEAAALLLPPIALASAGVERVLKAVLRRFHARDLDALLSSRETDSQHVAETALRELERRNYDPILVVDELDKILDDALISDFFDGNQAFFQGRRLIQSLSYTFGESTRDTLVTSIRRFSDVELFRGIVSPADVEAIVLARTRLAVTQAGAAHPDDAARKLFPTETLRALANMYAPNTNLVLNAAYSAVERAIANRSDVVSPDDFEQEAPQLPTPFERAILAQLIKTKAGPTELANRLGKTKQSVSRALLKMTGEGWVSRTGEGKRSYYSITDAGYLAFRQASRE